MTESVLLQIDDGVATITLNRPESLNAFDAEMADRWARVTAEVVRDDAVRAIVVLGAGRAFCAGGDVRAMGGFADRESELRALAARISDGNLALYESSKPVVAGAFGTTAGGGLGVLLCSDYAVVGTSSKLGSLYGGVGLTPDLSVSVLLARAVGERRALQLVLQERLLTAAEASEWGLVAEVVPDDEVRGRAVEVARRWADTVPYAYGQAKRLVREAGDRTVRDQLAEEARTIGATSVRTEGDAKIRAFLSR